MSEKRFIRKGTIISDIQNGTAYLLESASDYNRLLDLLNNLHEENTSLKKKITPSIYNKNKGDWKWNVDNNTILNIRSGEVFYLRNSGAVENLVHLLNKLEQVLSENEKMLQKDLDMLTELRRENEQLKCINDQLEERLENSGIGVALKMDCDKDE